MIVGANFEFSFELKVGIQNWTYFSVSLPYTMWLIKFDATIIMQIMFRFTVPFPVSSQFPSEEFFSKKTQNNITFTYLHIPARHGIAT